jgi:hypothetical protein
MAKDIGGETRIPRATLYLWHKKFVTNNQWRPYDQSVHGTFHRIFTDEEEAALKEYVVANYILPGNPFCDEDFPPIAMGAFLEKHAGNKGPIPEFNCSNGFISDFKTRNHISSRIAHCHRRPSVTPEQEAEWVSRLKGLLSTEPHSRILNVDETCWRVYPTGMKTWAEKGAQGVHLQISGNEKEKLTVLATVAADRTKLPLVILAEGKTDRVEVSQLGDVGPHFTDHSESGWTTTDTFVRYLRFLRERLFPDDMPIWLVLDCYSVHRDATVRSEAEALNIFLEFLPPGMTDAFQPLDRYVFGAMKAMCRRLYRQSAAFEPEARLTRPIAVQWLIRA